MLSFSNFLLIESKQLPWDKNPKIGWWMDAKKLTLYHGTNVANLESILKTGLTKKDPKTGMISLALEPNTSFGYAAMYGGEANFRSATATKAINSGKTNPNVRIAAPNERVVLVFEIPMSWIMSNWDDNLGGNIGQAYDNIRNKSKYEAWHASGKTDKEYYATAELRVKSEVPKKFLKGYMFKS